MSGRLLGSQLRTFKMYLPVQKEMWRSVRNWHLSIKGRWFETAKKRLKILEGINMYRMLEK